MPTLLGLPCVAGPSRSSCFSRLLRLCQIRLRMAPLGLPCSSLVSALRTVLGTACAPVADSASADRDRCSSRAASGLPAARLPSRRVQEGSAVVSTYISAVAPLQATCILPGLKEGKTGDFSWVLRQQAVWPDSADIDEGACHAMYSHGSSASHVDKVTKQMVLCSGQSPACH